jgi:hypothetical protein
MTEKRITQLLQLKLLLRGVTAVHDTMVNCRASILLHHAEVSTLTIGADHPQVLGTRSIKCIETIINGKRLAVLRLNIDRLSDDANLKRSAKGATAKNAKLHAVKVGVNKLLDVARNTHKENMDDIQDCKSESLLYHY